MNVNVDAKVKALSNALFEKSMTDNYLVTNKWFVGLFVFQWLGGIVAALCLSPATWQGAQSSTHPHVWQAVILGGITAGLPIYMIRAYPISPITRHVVAAAQMLFSALLIHISGGRIETHFHVFGSLAFLAFYGDWKILLTASGVIAVDHLLRGIFLPQSVFGVIQSSPLRALEHAAWVIFEDVFLIAASMRGTRVLRKLADKQAALEATNQIIEAKVAEQMEEIRAKEAQTQVILDTADDAILTVLQSGLLVSANSAAERFLGHNTAELASRNILDLLVLTDINQRTLSFADYANFYFKTPAKLPRVSGVRVSSGEVVPVEISLGKAELEGGTAFTIFIRNVAERRSAEDKIRSLYQFISTDLRSSVNKVSSAFRLIQSGTFSAEDGGLWQIFRIASQQAECSARLVNELVDLKQIEEQSLELNTEICSARHLIDVAIDGLAPFAAEAKVKFDVTCPAQLRIWGDPRRLLEVIGQLASNAIKASKEGDSIKIIASPASGNVIRILFVDRGVGIATQDVGSVFKMPDQMLPVGDTGSVGNLGLIICKALIEKHGGKIGFTSDTTRGSTFWFEIPSAEGKKRSTSGALDKTALLVGADPLIANTIMESFDFSGQKCVTKTNVEEAQKILSESLPSAIVVDAALPDGDVLTLLTYLRERRETCDLPLMVVGSTQGSPDTEGKVGFIVKGFDHKQFLREFEQVAPFQSGSKNPTVSK